MWHELDEEVEVVDLPYSTELKQGGIGGILLIIMAIYFNKGAVLRVN